jgi:carbohydrate-selective porin OprB
VGLVPGPLAPPNSQWGVQAVYSVTPVWQVAGGVFNNNPNATAGAKHGTNFAFRQGNTGALAVAQVNYLANQGPKDKGLPGQYTLGAVYDGNEFPNLATGALRDGNWNFYALAQQQVSGTSGGSGVTLWGGVTWASTQSVNLLPLTAGLGANWQGPFTGRANDIASAGWFYGKLSDTQPGASATQAIELNYQYAITSAVTLIGDFQYLWRLNGLPSPGAAVFGAQVNVTF